ncbi:alpha/beta hydrolase [soil metagenome]
MRHRNKRRPLAGAATIALLGLIVVYAGLSIYKAVDYTTTPPNPLPTRSALTEQRIPHQGFAFRSSAGDQVMLRGTWAPNPKSHRAIILVHGRCENRMSHVDLAITLRNGGFNILLFDLRGHGESDRTPSTYGLQERWDVLGAVEFVKRRGIAPEHIGVVGWSLGGTSAILAMSQSPDIAAVVSDSAYANGDPLLARNMLRPGLKLAHNIVRDIDIDKIRVDEAMAEIGERPVFLIHGAADQAVPASQAELLQQAGSAGMTETWIVPGAGHIGAYAMCPDEYASRVIAFFDEALG